MRASSHRSAGEHYEMAVRHAVAWARAMGHGNAVKVPRQTLDEEKAADKELSQLAEGGINKQAAAAVSSR